MDWCTQFDSEAAKYVPDVEILKDEPMSRHTSFKVGGPAKRMAFPKNSEQVVFLANYAHACGRDALILGNGTNLLIPDEGIDRLVIDMSTVAPEIRVEGPGILTANCGVSLSRLADYACKEGFQGFEFAHGIPGTLGGAICMNAGAYGGEMSKVVLFVTALFPGMGVRMLSSFNLDFGYRHSIFTDHPGAVLLQATLRLQPEGDYDQIRATMRDLMERRKASQPLEFPSAGSTFKRPEGHYASALIDQCGLKGLTVGGAQVSEKHAGFIINTGTATSKDILDLIRTVQERVKQQTGVQLEPEVKIVR